MKINYCAVHQDLCDHDYFIDIYLKEKTLIV